MSRSTPSFTFSSGALLVSPLRYHASHLRAKGMTERLFLLPSLVHWPYYVALMKMRHASSAHHPRSNMQTPIFHIFRHCPSTALLLTRRFNSGFLGPIPTTASYTLPKLWIKGKSL